MSDILEIIFLFIKGFGFIAGAMCTAFVGAASQWSNSNQSPSQLQWWIIAAVTAGAGFGALVAFTNSSFGEFIRKKNGNGSIPPVADTTPAPTTTPNSPIPGVKAIARWMTVAWAFSVVLVMLLCGCAYIHGAKASSTLTPDLKSAQLPETKP